MDESRSFGARSLRYSFVLLPVSLWACLCWDWPLRLGFFCDDWMILLHPFVGTGEAFKDVASVVATRPASAPFTWLMQVVADWSPVRSQISNAAMLLVTAASVGTLAASLSSVVYKLQKGALVGACFAAAAFIVFPSTIGTFAWGTGVTAVVPATPLFCIGASLLLHSEKSIWRLGIGLLLVLLSHLSYEAFYFQEVALLLIAATLRGGRASDIHWRAIILAVAINLGCIAFNRLIAGGIQRTYHPEFLHIFGGGYPRILAVLGFATREHKFLIACSILIAFVSGALCLTKVVSISRSCVALLLTVGGVVAAGLLYAAAGYGLTAVGVGARVCIVLATYFSVTSGVLAASAYSVASPRHRSAGFIFFLSSIVGLTALELTARDRVTEWADTWTYELARLSRLPEAITLAGPSIENRQRIYLALDQKAPSDVEPATAPWEINGAIAWATYNVTKSRSKAIDNWKTRDTATNPYWVATPPDWFNRWNGSLFEQGYCSNGAIVVSVLGSELWSWNTSTGDFSQIKGPWEYGCNRQQS